MCEREHACVCVYAPPTRVDCIVLGVDGLWEKDESKFPSSSCR